MSEIKKVIFDTDPGIDDVMALLFAHAHPQIDLVGITTVFGNATVEDTTRNALYVKERFSLSAPVSQGASAPLEIEFSGATTYVHGENGLGDIDIPKSINATTDPRPAFEFIIDTIKANPGEISIVAVGSMTNLALALNAAPEIATMVKEVIMMGGAFGHNQHTGNVTPFAEANIISDPHAADIVLKADWPIVTVGLDVTEEVLMTTDYLVNLKENAHEVGEFIWEISRFYQAFYKKTGLEDGFYVHDSTAFIYLLHPEFFETVSGPIRVVLDGVAMGHTIQKTTDGLHPIDEWTPYRAQKVCCNVNEEACLNIYADTLIAFNS